MRFLTVVFDSHDEFVAHYSDKYPNGALFCRTKADTGLRDRVIVDISMPEIRQPVRLVGQVISLSSGTGVWVHFDEASRESAQFLRHVAPSGSARLERSHSRYPTSLPVRCFIDEDNSDTDTVEGRVVDLSRGGAFITGDEAPLVGTRVCLHIDPLGRGSKSLRVDGRVAWVSEMSEAKRGFGVRFDQRGVHGAAPLRTMLRRASESGAFPAPPKPPGS